MIEAEAQRVYEEFEKLEAPAEVRAGQLRVLRAIRDVVIRDMVARLGRR